MNEISIKERAQAVKSLNFDGVEDGQIFTLTRIEMENMTIRSVKEDAKKFGLKLKNELVKGGVKFTVHRYVGTSWEDALNEAFRIDPIISNRQIRSIIPAAEFESTIDSLIRAGIIRKNEIMTGGKGRPAISYEFLNK